MIRNITEKEFSRAVYSTVEELILIDTNYFAGDEAGIVTARFMINVWSRKCRALTTDGLNAILTTKCPDGTEYIQIIYVPKCLRHRGFATQLLNEIKSTNSKLSLHVHEKNKDSLNFWKKNGFNIITKNQGPQIFMGTQKNIQGHDEW
ncbi:MAG: hypothetical protein HUK21_12480 [Fibrobacteraceae bacterium]|nr:hypothetical protein [Fibrobacteraceae bacterium]